MLLWDSRPYLNLYDYGFLWLQGKERCSLLTARFRPSGSIYPRSGIPWYWAERCLPAPHCVFADILWEAPPYCVTCVTTGDLSGHRWHHRDRGTSPGKRQRPYSVLWLSWQHSSRTTEWHRITACWRWKSMGHVVSTDVVGLCMRGWLLTARQRYMSQFHTSSFDITMVVGVGLSYSSLMTVVV